MPLRIFALVMLLACSAMVETSYAGSSQTSREEHVPVMAELVKDESATARSNMGKAPIQAEPPIRVILPSPYKVRAN